MSGLTASNKFLNCGKEAEVATFVNDVINLAHMLFYYWSVLSSAVWFAQENTINQTADVLAEIHLPLNLATVSQE